jgi:nucleoid-associated protein YgaU
MGAWKSLGATGQGIVAGVAVAVTGAIGWAVLSPSEPPMEPLAAVSPTVAPAPAVAAAPQAAPDPAPMEVPPEPPGFDTVRVEPDGSALVAGRAEPGAGIAVLLDGAEVASTAADGAGGFAALFTLPPSDSPRMMTLAMVLADGRRIGSTDSVAIAPVAGPQVVAEAAPEPVPEPAPEPAPEPNPETAPEDAPQAAPEPDQTPTAPLLVTDAGAQVLAAPAEGAVTIDAISYAPDGAVQLAGHGGAETAVRLYLDNAEVALTRVDGSGRWAVTLPDTAPGIYTLRADQVDGSGKVTARFETPFKRETVAALAAVAAPEPVAVAAPEPVSPPEPVAVAAPEPAPEPASEPVPVAAAPLATAPAEPAPAEPAPAEPTPQLATAPTPAPAPAPDVRPQPVTVTVQPGFTLWQIARDNFGEGVLYVQVFEANRDRIRDPDLIYPGQVFSLPAPAN